jgi:hypothetical protein
MGNLAGASGIVNEPSTLQQMGEEYWFSRGNEMELRQWLSN